MKVFSEEEEGKVKEIIKKALEEDKVNEDYTTLWCVPKDKRIKAEIVVKQDGVICGLWVTEMVFKMVSSNIEFKCLKKDGDKVKRFERVATIKGSAANILRAERTALNFLQRLSGIASLTAKFVERVKPFKAKILDTRKTTPGLRILEKYAVRTGGGENHRKDLKEMVLLKDNHIAVAGGIEKAVDNLLKNKDRNIDIEVEVKTLDELRIVLKKGIKRILLDNMSTEDLKEAVKITEGRALLEASGGVDLSNVAEIAETGVDFISVGKITHSAPALDISLEIVSKG